MEKSENSQENQPVNGTVSESYRQLLVEVRTYWKKGKNGDLKAMVDKEAYKDLGLTKGYFKGRANAIIRGEQDDYDILLAMYKHIVPRKNSVIKAVKDIQEITARV